ncbi:sugar ABC transporter permease [Jiangella rhizosphaerae]|uniref:Sugar ABC transporter permease n=1 Tax=Jiangella rhizosphaerae TaxID=2293569 RepID=A0A418KJR9_9ACTN|nr:sugar ABC transporter permease [Jiangella rhizosphaerae]
MAGARWPYLFLLPTVVLFGAYTVWPVLASWWYSLLSWTGFSAEKTFVGLQNYRDVVADPLFWNSFKITMLFMVVTVPLRVGLGLLLALLLNHPRLPLQRLFRTAFFLPVVTTTAIVGVVMQFVLDPAGGPVNLGLQEAGLDGVDFLGSSSTALWTVMAVHTWKWVGVTMIYWLAALQTVPRELTEAAQVDGASSWQSFRHVTLPLLVPFLVIITLLTVEQNLQVFDLMMTMTGGGPFFATEVIELYIYRWAFGSSPPQLGFASAAAVVLGVVLLVVGIGQLLGIRAARRMAGAES